MAVAGAGGNADPQVTVEPAELAISDGDLFRGALGPEPQGDEGTPAGGEQASPAPRPAGGSPGDQEPPPPQPQGQPQGQPQAPAAMPGYRLDEHGRLHRPDGTFASPQEVNQWRPPADGAQPQQPGGQQQQRDELEDAQGRVPSWRLREQREAFDRQMATMQQNYDRVLAMVEGMQRGPQPQRGQPQPQPQQMQLPDPLLDPQGYHRAINEQMNYGLRAVALENNLRLTSLSYGKAEFEQAYNAFLAAGQQHPDFARSVVNSEDPGERIMSWYTNQRTLSEIGGNPEAWMARKLEEALANPTFLARAVAAATAMANGGAPRLAQPGGGAPPPQQGGGRMQVVLPPSLSAMRGSSEAGDPEVDYGNGVNVSDGEIFKDAMTRPARNKRR